MLDIVTTPKQAAKTGIGFATPPNAAIEPRVAALVEHADEQEQRAGREPVVHHLEHAAVDAP